MKEKKYIEAMMHYTEAIKLDSSKSAFYANRYFLNPFNSCYVIFCWFYCRCLAFLKMDQYFMAMQDAKTAIKLDPKWFKVNNILFEYNFLEISFFQARNMLF